MITGDIPEASRNAALEQLREFLPRAGVEYARTRNYDRGPDDRRNTSCLSPYVRHRLVSEEELVSHTLAEHTYESAEKFIDEVCWRTYWKGWLEMRPRLWDNYLESVSRLSDNKGNQVLQRALEGDTGIDCFDFWVKELRDSGYLHNHARMWFASIWIFTLELPWQLGAHFFYNHLLDGDPASNTLSWRWVAGLQTRGKQYLAKKKIYESSQTTVSERKGLKK